METISQFLAWIKVTWRKQGTIQKIFFLLVGLLIICCLCSVPAALFSSFSSQTSPEKTLSTSIPISSEKPIDVLSPTYTQSVEPTIAQSSTPPPTKTPLPPTQTQDPNIIKPGTYMVGSEINPGIYKGEAYAGDSCYWARLKDFTGNSDAIIANENGIGQFYVEILEGDFAFETDCELKAYESIPNNSVVFPQTIDTGMYLIGSDIQVGTYKGQAVSDDSCYWARLSDATGGPSSIIANDNSVGQFYIQVLGSDFALQTDCELIRVGD